VDQLRQELTTSLQEVQRLKQELDAHQINMEDLLTQESLRQQAVNLKSALLEREQDIKDADAARYLLEDELEDAHRKIDALKFQTGSAPVQKERKPTVSEQPDEEEDLELYRDPRIQPSQEPLNLAEESHLGKILMGGIVGILTVLALMEALSFLSGKGELFSLILS